MRLIDADALIGELRDLADKNYEKTQCYMGIIGAIGRVQDAPIAYDVEKVVEALEDAIFLMPPRVKGHYADNAVFLEDAINIVRAGGDNGT